MRALAGSQARVLACVQEGHAEVLELLIRTTREGAMSNTFNPIAKVCGSAGPLRTHLGSLIF